MIEFIILQTLDGRDVHVNPAAIVSISETSETRDPSKKLMTSKVHCVVNMTNGKFITVIEHCDSVRQRLQKGMP